jgi:hypothetical protein
MKYAMHLLKVLASNQRRALQIAADVAASGNPIGA